ncbi:MAG TPA: hypothetical protein VG096_19205 [Bryobacteraceae bacterium]|nr:hypothetical protein [Bryobacteraceae bacterium]
MGVAYTDLCLLRSKCGVGGGTSSGFYRALHEISLALAPGTVTALMGRSVRGKTTLLNLAGGQGPGGHA